MNKNMLRRMSLTTMAAMILVALAGCEQNANATGPELAKVVSVEAITKTIKNPRQVCEDVVVRHRSEPTDSHEIAGTAIGAIVGGAVGNQVGDGSGQKLATVAGAIAGGYAGKRIQEAQQEPNVTTTTEQRCHTETDTDTRVIGYDVAYSYNGGIHHVRMDEKPGATVPVRQGVMVVK